jgi:mitochondrial protein import protein ZIM17
MRQAASCVRCLARIASSQAPPASPQPFIPAYRRLYHPLQTSICPKPLLGRRLQHPLTSIVRHESSSSSNPLPQASTEPLPSRLERDQVPSYELTFTCKKCSTRSSHRVSKQGYHHGTVLITCPGCKNRHLISDHLKVPRNPKCTATPTY